MPSTMSSSSLLGRLPTEIKDEIFGLLLTVPEAIVLDLAGAASVRIVDRRAPKPCVALLYVDKTTYFSTLPILYGTNTFSGHYSPAVITTFLAGLGDGKKYLKQLGLQNSTPLPDLKCLGNALCKLDRPTALHVKLVDSEHWPMATPQQIAFCMLPWIRKLVKKEGSLERADKRVLRLIRVYPAEMTVEKDLDALSYSCEVKQDLKRLLRIEMERDGNRLV